MDHHRAKRPCRFAMPLQICMAAGVLALAFQCALKAQVGSKGTREDLARAAMRNAIQKLDKPKAPRTELLEAFREIARRYGDTEIGPRACEAVHVLDQMVREDRERV